MGGDGKAVTYMLLKDARAIQNWPPAPLDQLIDELGGPKKVAEMTGRSQRVVRARSGALELDLRGGSQLNVLERAAFQSGTKEIGIISEAASTGVSLHADKRVCSFPLR